MTTDEASLSDDEIVALYERIRERAVTILAARTASRFEQHRKAGKLYVAHYWRHFSNLTEDFLTLDEAIGFLRCGEEGGDLSSERITGPDGYILEDRELSDRIWAMEDVSAALHP